MSFRIIATICIGAALCFSLTSCDSEHNEEIIVRPVKTMVVPAASDLLKVSFPGKTEPIREVNMAFEVPGRLVSLPVKAGDWVERGNLVAKLNQDAYRARYEASKAKYKQAENDTRRLLKLLASKNVSQTQLDAAQTALDVAASNYALNKKQLEDTTLTAPFSGQVVAVYLDNFTYAPTSTQVARIVDTTRLEFWVDVPETLAKLYKASMSYQVSLEFDAFPGVFFPAVPKEFKMEASNKTRTFAASFVMTQREDITILAGMSGLAHIEVPRKDAGMSSSTTIPVNALFTSIDSKVSSVWVVEEDRVTRRNVIVGELSNSQLEVKEGLQPGDKIVTAGVHYLKEGQIVSSQP